MAIKQMTMAPISVKVNCDAARLSVLTLLAVGAALFATSARAANSMPDATARYQAERAVCLNGLSNQDLHDVRNRSAGTGLIGGEPDAFFEMLHRPGRNETGPVGIHMPVTVRRLLLHKDALWNDQMQVLLGARHGDIQQTALLFDIRR